MSKGRRVREVIFGIFTILLSFLIFASPEAGLKITIGIFCITLLAAGLRYIVYYVKMARYMVGGKQLLFLGIAIFDLGLFSLSLNNVPLAFVVLYLLVAYAFSGVIGIMRALESRSYGKGSKWKLRFTTGIINIIIAILAILCGVVFKSSEAVIGIYCAGLFYSAVIRIITAFRRSAIVYIA